MARRKLKPEPVSPPPDGEVVADLTAAEAEAHARAASVTDPAAFEFPIPPAAETDPPAATAGADRTPAPETGAEGRPWKPVFGLRGDHEAG